MVWNYNDINLNKLTKMSNFQNHTSGWSPPSLHRLRRKLIHQMENPSFFTLTTEVMINYEEMKISKVEVVLPVHFGISAYFWQIDLSMYIWICTNRNKQKLNLKYSRKKMFSWLQTIPCQIYQKSQSTHHPICYLGTWCSNMPCTQKTRHAS